MPFAVEYEALHDLFGSRDEVVFAKFLAEMPRELDALDDEEEPEIRDRLPARVALRQIVMGELLDPDLGHIYAYLIEALCLAYDSLLSNRYWSPVNSTWLIGPFDDALQKIGIPASTFSVRSHLLHRGSPFPIPPPSDFPGQGYLTPAEVRTASELLAPIDPDRFRHIGGHDSFRELAGWLVNCRDTARGLVCFYH